MYSYQSRVSYSQVNSKLELTYFALVNYIQDVGCFHSDEIGYGMSYLTENNLGWFVTSYEIHIKRMPRYGETIRICTYPYAFRGMMARRKYTIELLNGEILAYADSQWVLMDIAEGRMFKAPEAMIKAYDDGIKAPELNFDGDRLRLNDKLEEVGTIAVTENYIDTNGHMNNAFYIDLTRSFLPEQSFGSIVINYKKAALLGDNLQVYLVKLERGFQIVLKRNDEVYTIVEYK